MKNTVLFTLGFGDEGKGAWTEYFAVLRRANLSIRYTGGPQGGHFVRKNGQSHMANQFSAASLMAPNLHTVIAGHLPVDPLALLRESWAMSEEFGESEPLSRIFLMYYSPVITPAHRFLRQTRETFSGHRVGTSGAGVTELRKDIAAGDENLVFRVQDFFLTRWRRKLTAVMEYQLEKALGLYNSLKVSREKLEEMVAGFRRDYPFDRVLDDCETLACGVRSAISKRDLRNLIKRRGPKIFEPAQGTLLDARYGFAPYVTGSPTTLEPLVQYGLKPGETEYIALSRAYLIRHGPGPLPTETDELGFPDDNGLNEFQGKFRFGWLDLVMMRYAWAVNRQFINFGAAVNLAISHLDQFSGFSEIKVCVGYRHTLERSERTYFEFGGDDLVRSIRLNPPAVMPAVTSLLQKCQPEYVILPGWQEDISGCRSYAELPAETRDYLKFISDDLGLPVGYVGVGPNLEQRFAV